MSTKNLLLLGLLTSFFNRNTFSAEKELSSLTLSNSPSDNASCCAEEAHVIDTTEEKKDCSICYNPKTPENRYTLPCHPDHEFHKTCIKEWINTYSKTTCPLCRTHISKENLRELGGSFIAIHSARSQSIQDLINRSSLPPITTPFPGYPHLRFLVNAITSLEGSNNIPGKERIAHLSFVGPSFQLEVLPANAFKEFNNLTDICIHGSALKKISAHAFDRLPYLKKIDIQYNSELVEIEPGAFTAIAGRLEEVRHLEEVFLGDNRSLSEETKRRVKEEILQISPATRIIP